MGGYYCLFSRAIVWIGITVFCCNSFAGNLPTIEELIPNEENLTLTINKSQLLALNVPATRVSVVAPEIADVQILDPKQILITARQVGETTVIVWTEDDKTRMFDVCVDWNTQQIERQLKHIMPDDSIEVLSTDHGVALSGSVGSIYGVERAMNIASAYSSEVLNLMEVPGVHQVMLKVKIAEVARSFRDEIGINFRYLGSDFQGGSLLGNLASGDLGGQLTVADAVTTFFGIPGSNIEGYVKALKEKGLLEILAEPNLVARSGEKASFLAGGEFPIPVVQSGSNNSITIEYKEFGVKVDFSPTVTEDQQIQMEVLSEVSDLDFSQGLELGGYVIPTVITRRTNTVVKLRDGQTFAIAGLISKGKQITSQKVPGVGDIPLFGNLFKSKQLEETETELLVMITPQLVAPLNDADDYPGPSEIDYESMSPSDLQRLETGLKGVLDDPAIKTFELPEAKNETLTEPDDSAALSMNGAALHSSTIQSTELPKQFDPLDNPSPIALRKNDKKAVSQREEALQGGVGESEKRQRYQRKNSKGKRIR
ncbi:MAG: type II and III secretion system protein family protein [Candidatus Hinthialibacter antarcticus]|nr:type II and III secretion system protein family protein [Candidatus Hinthialibacter antarcticus]